MIKYSASFNHTTSSYKHIHILFKYCLIDQCPMGHMFKLRLVKVAKMLLFIHTCCQDNAYLSKANHWMLFCLWCSWNYKDMNIVGWVKLWESQHFYPTSVISMIVSFVQHSQNYDICTLINWHTPTGGTAGPLPLFVIPCPFEGNTAFGTDPAEKHNNAQFMCLC